MYTRTYNLDKERFVEDINLIKDALLDLNGISDVKVLKDTNGLTVDFDSTLSEKQILSTINQYRINRTNVSTF